MIRRLLLRRPFATAAPSAALPVAAIRSQSDQTVELALQGPDASSSPATARFHYAWLRDHCQCPLCVHSSTRQKLHSSGDVDPRVQPRSVSVRDGSLILEWGEGSVRHPPAARAPHTTTLPIDWLLANSYQKSLTRHRPAEPTPTLWDASSFATASERVSYDEYMGTDEGLRKVLGQMRRFGLCFLTGVPVEDEKEVERCARRIGCVRDTFYGTSWDVKSVQSAKNIAYTSLDLGLHMDLMYFEAPPGVQLLHSLKNSVKGGESTFLDMLEAVRILRAAHPAHYSLLTRVPVTFHYKNDGHDLIFHRPTIVEHDANEGVRLFYAPPFQGQLTRVDEDDVVPFYEAFGHLTEILRRPELIHRTRLVKGEVAMFHNRRVLHGRDEFNTTTGDRHFKGCYVDWDDIKDKMRVFLD
ncbi:hypothetical protein HK101_009206 [Irineochytrium annulatum]|nr:hypothetical protein HK101_009206 [Irineochytrium annulatum]